jgi:hypothetical protein
MILPQNNKLPITTLSGIIEAKSATYTLKIEQY